MGKGKFSIAMLVIFTIPCWILGIIVEFYSFIIAYKTTGIVGLVVTILFQGVAQAYWLVKSIMMAGWFNDYACFIYALSVMFVVRLLLMGLISMREQRIENE